jgi:hypothetical protein
MEMMRRKKNKTEFKIIARFKSQAKTNIPAKHKPTAFNNLLSKNNEKRLKIPEGNQNP